MYEPDSNGRESDRTFTPDGNVVAIDLEQYAYNMNVVGNVLWQPNQEPMRYEATGVYGECEGVYRFGAFVPYEDSGNGPCGYYD